MLDNQRHAELARKEEEELAALEKSEPEQQVQKTDEEIDKEREEFTK